jgi:DNA-binding response OmpR family regulator
VRLNFRCSFLREHGFEVLSSTRGYEGLIEFSHDKVEAVILDLDAGGTELALVAGELRRMRQEIPILILVPDGAVAEGALECASVAVPRSEEPDSLLAALENLLKPADKKPEKNLPKRRSNTRGKRG